MINDIKVRIAYYEIEAKRLQDESKDALAKAERLREAYNLILAEMGQDSDLTQNKLEPGRPTKRGTTGPTVREITKSLFAERQVSHMRAMEIHKVAVNRGLYDGPYKNFVGQYYGKAMRGEFMVKEGEVWYIGDDEITPAPEDTNLFASVPKTSGATQ